MLLQHNVLLCNTLEKEALQCDLMIASEHKDQMQLHRAREYEHTHKYTLTHRSKHINAYM